MQSPDGTLKNISPMKTIMKVIIFCVARCCSSSAGGMNIFCCTRKSTIVMIGSTFR